MSTNDDSEEPYSSYFTFEGATKVALEKWRVKLPASIGRRFGGHRITLFNNGSDQAIRIFLGNPFQNMSSEDRRLAAAFCAVVEPDSSYRIFLPREFRRAAFQMSEEAEQALKTTQNFLWIVGCDTYLELWRDPQWKEERQIRAAQTLKMLLDYRPSPEI